MRSATFAIWALDCLAEPSTLAFSVANSRLIRSNDAVKVVGSAGAAVGAALRKSRPAVGADPTAAPSSTATMLPAAGVNAKRRDLVCRPAGSGAGPVAASSARGIATTSAVPRVAVRGATGSDLAGCGIVISDLRISDLCISDLRISDLAVSAGIPSSGAIDGESTWGSDEAGPAPSPGFELAL